MPVQLYSSGGESSVQRQHVQPAPVANTTGLLNVLESFSNELYAASHKETQGRIVDIAAKAQQDKMMEGSWEMADTPKFLSTEFYNVYEASSRKVLRDELKNDVRDMAMQAVHEHPSDPEAFKLAYREQYRKFREKLSANPEFSRDFLPELDDDYRTSLSTYGLEVNARRLNYLEQDMRNRADTVFQGKAKALRDKAMRAGFGLKDIKDFETRYNDAFDADRASIGETLDIAHFSPDDKYARLDPLEDDVAEDYLYSAITSAYVSGNYELAQKIVIANANGELFRENPSISARMRRAGGGATDVMRYFAENAEKQVKSGMRLTDLADRIKNGNDASEFAKGIARTMPEGATPYEAIRSVFATLYATDKGPQSAWKDREATVYLGDLLNTQIISGGVDANKLLSMFMNADGTVASQPKLRVEQSAGGQLGTNELFIGEVSLGKYDASDKSITSSTEALADMVLVETSSGQKNLFTSPSFNTGVLQPVLMDMAKQKQQVMAAVKSGNKAPADAYFDFNKAALRDPREVARIDDPNISTVDGGRALAAYVNQGNRSARGWGLPMADIGKAPLNTHTVLTFKTELTDSISSAARNPNKAGRIVRTMFAAGSNIEGATGDNALRQLGDMQYAALVSMVFTDPAAQGDLLVNSNTANVNRAWSDQNLSIINSGLAKLVAKSGANAEKITALSNGLGSAQGQYIWDKVLWPYIVNTSLKSDPKTGEVDVAGSIESAIDEEGTLGQLMKKLPKPVAINSQNPSMGKTLDPRWYDPNVQSAMTKLSQAFPTKYKNMYPVVSSMYDAEKKTNVQVLRLAPSFGGTEFARDGSNNIIQVVIGAN